MQAEERATNLKKAPLVLLLNAIFGSMVGMALLFVFAILVWNEWLGEGMLKLLPFAAAFLASLICGFLSGKALGKGLLTGMLQGLFLFALLYLLGLLIFIRIAPQEINPALFLSCLSGSIIGGVLSAGRRKSPVRYRHRK